MSKKKRGPGAPIGNKNNPHGRPPTVSAVAKVFARLDEGSAHTLEGLKQTWQTDTSGAIRRSINEAGDKYGVKGKG